jgi:Tfp pilus assembly protein PilV
MTSLRARLGPPAEGGFVLIEILVSALVLAIVAGAILTLLQSSARSAGQQRDGSKAYAVAQEDQARLRAMRLATLNGLNQISNVALDGSKFTVESSGVFVNNTTSEASCTGGSASADYVRITSKVSWTGMGSRPPTVVRSIFKNGTLTISTMNGAGLPLAGVGISLTGPATFSGTTDSTGCANFADIPATLGNYTMTPSAPGLVDENGKAPASKTVGVPASGTQTVELRYDLPGSFTVPFSYRVGSSEEFKPSSASSIMVFNPGMETAKSFSVGSTPAASIEAKGLFPFTSPYAVYAGSCTSNNPNPKSEPGAPGALAVASIVVPPGAAAPPPIPTIQLPALNLTVKSGASTVTGAKVRITGTCSFDRTYTTLTGGLLSDPGLPWGTYEVCASANISGTNRRIKKSSIVVQNLTSGTTLNLDVSGSGSESGKTC